MLFRPDLPVSCPERFQRIYASGTISAAMAAALKGIKAMAFSMVKVMVMPEALLILSGATIIASSIIEAFLYSSFMPTALNPSSRQDGRALNLEG